jgi:hypothetical protein
VKDLSKVMFTNAVSLSLSSSDIGCIHLPDKSGTGSPVRCHGKLSSLFLFHDPLIHSGAEFALLTHPDNSSLSRAFCACFDLQDGHGNGGGFASRFVGRVLASHLQPELRTVTEFGAFQVCVTVCRRVCAYGLVVHLAIHASSFV